MTVASNLLAANVSGMETDISGWAGGANTTLTWSTRFFTGAHSLQMTATAAGSVTATTVNRVAVTAGTELMAYAFYAGITATTGRTTTVTLTFYAAATGGTAITSVTSGTVALPNATTWVTPPPVIITTVPVGATYATLTVTAAGLAAGGAVAMDAAAVGPGNLATGNLLSYAAQGMEIDSSHWTAVSGATITTSSADAWEGYRSLQITSTAAGNALIRGTDSVPVTPGTVYFAYSSVSAPTSGLTWITQIDWQDSGGGVISSSSQTWTSVATGWRRLAVIGTAPTGSVTARVVLRPQSTAAGQVWLADQIAIRVAPIITGNLLDYNTQSVEIDISGWTAVSGCTIARSTSTSWEGAASVAITMTGGDAVVTLSSHIPVTPRQAYRLAPTIKADTAGPTLDIFWQWYDASGTLISSSDVLWDFSTEGGWYAPVGGGVAPAGAVTGVAGLRFYSMTAGQVYNLDAVAATANGLGAIADPLPDLYGMRISLQGLTTDSMTTWTLLRMEPDGTTTALRSTTGTTYGVVTTSDTEIVDDYEAPLGVPLQYYVEVHNAGGAMDYMTSDPATIPGLANSQILLRDPTLPARWTLATAETLPDWQRSARQGINVVRGRARPIVISDARSSRTGTLVVTTERQEERDALWWVLDTGDALLLQWPGAWHEDSVYVSVGDVTAARVSPQATYADREWTLPLAEVDAPTGPLSGSPDRTWADLVPLDSWMTVLTTYTSWLGVLTGLEEV